MHCHVLYPTIGSLNQSRFCLVACLHEMDIFLILLFSENVAFYWSQLHLGVVSSDTGLLVHLLNISIGTQSETQVTWNLLVIGSKIGSIKVTSLDI